MSHSKRIKIIMVGDSGVGKTSIANRLEGNRFCQNTLQTIGVDFATIEQFVNGERVKVQIWDTAGQERYRSITRSYYNGAVGAIFVFDLTREDSFRGLKAWLDQCGASSCGPDCKKMIIGNKVDLKDTRVVSEDAAKEFCKCHACAYMETSAKDNINLSEAIRQICIEIIDSQKKNLKENGKDDYGALSPSEQIDLIEDLKKGSSSSSRCRC